MGLNEDEAKMDGPMRLSGVRLQYENTINTYDSAPIILRGS